MTMDIFLLVFLLIAAVWTVMAARLLASVIGFAVTSAILTILIFRLNAPLAGVFELSVGAGLIPVLFVATIGLTQRLTGDKLQARRTDHRRGHRGHRPDDERGRVTGSHRYLPGRPGRNSGVIHHLCAS